jgi:hypothetical protein
VLDLQDLVVPAVVAPVILATVAALLLGFAALLGMFSTDFKRRAAARDDAVAAVLWPR